VAVGLEGRNLLIGGAGADTLQGGAGDDILIGGTTVYDGKAAALAVIMKEWTSTNSFEDRRKNLETGVVQLTKRTNTNRKGTVLDDGVRDSLFGGGGSDWFFDFAKDQLGAR
jgi:Ca2+-binding RTX toxin-like protein